MVVLGSGIAYGSWSKGAVSVSWKRTLKALSTEEAPGHVRLLRGPALRSDQRLTSIDSKYLRGSGPEARSGTVQPWHCSRGVIDFDQLQLPGERNTEHEERVERRT
ncbi:MAG: hypothetical protein MZV70_43840 [Desulfobacterales bacterium]|nr:hypothetical protein [Desulfobacterales bacterium]